MRKRLTKVMVLCVVAVLALRLAYWFFYSSHLSHVHLTNLAEDPLFDVVLHVSGRSYKLGSVDAKTSVAVDVFPHYDSHLIVEFTSCNGIRKRLDASGYFGPNTPAFIEITMDSNIIHSSIVRYR